MADGRKECMIMPIPAFIRHASTAHIWLDKRAVVYASLGSATTGSVSVKRVPMPTTLEIVQLPL